MLAQCKGPGANAWPFSGICHPGQGPGSYVGDAACVSTWGRLSRPGGVASCACATWKRRPSSKGRPIRRMPVGRLYFVKPDGAASDGNPVELQGKKLWPMTRPGFVGSYSLPPTFTVVP